MNTDMAGLWDKIMETVACDYAQVRSQEIWLHLKYGNRLRL